MPPLRTNLGIPLVVQKWSLNLRSLMVLLEQLTCILTDSEDWLQAESELVQQRTKAVAAQGASLEILAPVEFS